MEKTQDGIMMRIARFVVNKRKAFIVLFALACIYSVLSVSKVKVIGELTEYLAEDTETRQGLDIMEEEFVTFGSARILVSNITYEKAEALADELEEIKGISGVSFYRMGDEDYEDAQISDSYRDACALFDLTFEEEEDTPLSQAAIVSVRQALDGYNAYVYTTVDLDEEASLQNDMKGIVVVVVIVIIGVLLFTSKTYMEIVIFMIVFGVAAILNMGTNYWFGSVSFVTNAVGAVLQLALAIDYAIILFHRFMEEKEDKDTINAMTVALSKAIPEISSSSLTTVSGMVALMFMKFGIGMDLGRVLAKAIVFSLLTVFLLMPALIVMFADPIEKTRHRSFVPSIRAWGRLVVKARYITLPVFLALVAGACVFAQKCPYIYDVNSIDTDKKNEYLTSKDRIEETFEVTNTMAVLVPRGDYEKEGKILKELERMDEVESALGLANVEVSDDGKYILVDKLNPREFSEVADVDLDLVRVLYQFYAAENQQYSAFMKNLDDYRVSIIDMIDFIYQQKENGGIDFDEEKSEEIDSLYEQICDARKQLEGENYDRLVFNLKGPVEGAETFAVIDRIHGIVNQYYDEAYVVGDATNNYDLSSSFQTDNIIISVLTALLVGIVLLFTFQSAGLPFLLVLTIQGSIWINFAIPYLTGTTMFFLSYLIVSAIQMGATIDYAIVITSRYLELRKTMPDRKQAVVETLNQAFPTIITSGTMLVCAGFAVGNMTYNGTIASLGKALGLGALISIGLVMTALPQLLLVFDKWIDRTELTRNERPAKDSRPAEKASEKAVEKTVEKAAVCLLAAVLLSYAGSAPVYAETGSAEQTAGQAAEQTTEQAAEKVYDISTGEEFCEFAKNCVSEEFSAGASFVLTDDIDLSPWENVTVPVFAGNFSGAGHHISGVRISAGGSNMGLFRYVTQGAVIEDLKVEGRVSPQGSGTNVGGIAGNNRGTIRSCQFAGEAAGQESVGGIAGYNGPEGSILECWNKAAISADLKTGGIAGYNEGSVRGCRNQGPVNMTEEEDTSGGGTMMQTAGNVDLEQVLEQEKVNDTGGIAGLSLGNLSSCINYGIVGCAHTGYNTGGIAGRQSGIISGCVNYGEVRGRKDVGGIVGQLEPYLSVTYEEDTLNTLEDQLDSLNRLGDSLSRLVEDSSDVAENNLDQIGNQVDTMLDVERFFKNLLKSDKNDFSDDMDPYMDTIDDILDDMDLRLISRSSKETMARIRYLEDEERRLRKELDQGYQGTPGDLEALRKWLELEQNNLRQIEKNAEEMAQLTAKLSREAPEYAMGQAEDFADDVLDLTAEIQDMADSARFNLEIVDGDLENMDSAMTVQMDSLSEDIDTLTGDLKDSKSQIREQKRMIEEQLDRIQTTLSDGLEAEREGSSHALFEDVSDEAAGEEETADGTVTECRNEGVVTADHQGGGITGMIGTEISLDPEEDLEADEERTLNISRSANAVVRLCVNHGDVQVKYDCAGGIAGKTNLGTLAGNQNYGDVEAGGQYAGGIAGSSGHVLRQNYSMCAVTGKDYVGGIAGWACDLYENGAMADLSGASGEWLGSVAGDMDPEAEAEGNSYVDDGLGAIDGVTRTGQARGLAYEEFTAMEQVPEEFNRLTVLFLADGQVLERKTCRYGDGIPASDIPALPQKEGFYGQWEDKDLSCVRNSMKVHAVYHPWVSAIASSEDKAPLLLAEAEFYPGTRLEAEEISASELPDIPSGYRLAGRYSYRILTPEGEEFAGPVRLHVLAGEKRKTFAAALLKDNKAELTDSRRDGTYLVFDGDSQGEILLLERQRNLWKWIWIPIAVLLAGALIYRKKFQ